MNEHVSFKCFLGYWLIRLLAHCISWRLRFVLSRGYTRIRGLQGCFSIAKRNFFIILLIRFFFSIVANYQCAGLSGVDGFLFGVQKPFLVKLKNKDNSYISNVPENPFNSIRLFLQITIIEVMVIKTEEESDSWLKWNCRPEMRRNNLRKRATQVSFFDIGTERFFLSF